MDRVDINFLHFCMLQTRHNVTLQHKFDEFVINQKQKKSDSKNKCTNFNLSYPHLQENEKNPIKKNRQYFTSFSFHLMSMFCLIVLSFFVYNEKCTKKELWEFNIWGGEKGDTVYIFKEKGFL